MKDNRDEKLFELFSDMGTLSPNNLPTEKILLKINEIENSKPIISPFFIITYLVLGISLPLITYFLMMKDSEVSYEPNLIFEYINSINFDFSYSLIFVIICINVIITQSIFLIRSKSSLTVL